MLTEEQCADSGRLSAIVSVAAYADQFALLVDSVQEYAIYLMDVHGRIRTWNSGGQRIKGYAPNEIIGQHFSRMFTEPDRAADKPNQLLAEAASKGCCRDEGWRVRKDGTCFWASVVITAVHDGSGRLVGFAKVSRDETERHVMEDQIRQHAAGLEEAVAQRTHELAERNRILEEQSRELAQQAELLQKANAGLERFSAVLTHDLRAPLRSISVFAELLLRPEHIPTTDQQQHYVRRIVEGTQRMRLLIDDLTRLIAVDHGPGELVPLDSNEVLRAALDNLSYVITSRNAAISVGTLPRVRGCAIQVTQVFQNLIENALKYGPADDPRVHIEASEQDGWVRFAIRDNGIGIDPNDHERIFAAFQRLHSEEDYPGLGMGLAICAKIVQRHGGRMSVESAPGKGSTFFFTLPAV